MLFKELRRCKRNLERQRFGDSTSTEKLQKQTFYTTQPARDHPRTNTNGTNPTPTVDLLLALSLEIQQTINVPKVFIGSPALYDDTGRALYVRPSDKKLVYLECCVAGCNRNDFKSVQGLLSHVTLGTQAGLKGRRGGHGLKGLLSDFTETLERCGKELTAPKATISKNARTLSATSGRLRANLSKGRTFNGDDTRSSSPSDDESVIDFQKPQRSKSNQISMVAPHRVLDTSMLGGVLQPKHECHQSTKRRRDDSCCLKTHTVEIQDNKAQNKVLQTSFPRKVASKRRFLSPDFYIMIPEKVDKSHFAKDFKGGSPVDRKYHERETTGKDKVLGKLAYK